MPLDEEVATKPESWVEAPPKGLAILAVVGPSLVWCAEYIGSGEVILATRAGAILGVGVAWAIVSGIFLKYWIGMSGARYTVCTGEGMIDMLGRMPGPKNWAVWITLVAQLISATISIGSIAAAAGIFVSSLLPLSPYVCGWLVTIFTLSVVWSGGFDILETVMSVFVAIIVIGVLYVAIQVFPGMSVLIGGFVLEIPAVPAWALAEPSVYANPWREILPLLGWAAGGFASQVWYTYWVLGAGYGAARGQGYGEPADTEKLGAMSRDAAEKVKGWCRVVYTDASVAMVIGIVITIGFLIVGTGVLAPRHLAPEGPKIAITLSTIFASQWGQIGGILFLLAGSAAMIGTQIGQMAGWPRLLADTFRICIPGFSRRFSWKTQFRLFLVLFLVTNMIIVFTLGLQPVFLVKVGAILDGLLLTPLQALWVGLGLYVVLPRMLSKDAYEVLRPHWIFGAGLLVAFLVFSYFCIFQIPYVL